MSTTTTATGENTVSGRSWAATARLLRRDRLLDSATELLLERPWSEVTMTATAERAGLSRQTLYNEFRSRAEFAQSYAMREAVRFITDFEEALAARRDDPRVALTSAFESFLFAAAENPMVIAIASGNAGELLRLFTTSGHPIVTASSQRLALFMSGQWAWFDLRSAQLVAETIVRLAISHAALQTGPPDKAAAEIIGIIGPYIDRLTNTSGP